MPAERSLIVIADDLGIGPETTRAIVECARRGVVTATVLLTNSPHAADGVAQWEKAGNPGELGWHPCLTMDEPLASPGAVRSLVAPSGTLWPLREFVPRALLGLIRAEHVARELLAQYRRFIDLTGGPPALVASHQHVAVFPPVGAVLRDLLRRQQPRPYLRRIQEPIALLARVRGARLKRAFLNSLGRPEARRQVEDGFPGAEWMIGVTDPRWVADPGFWHRWLACVPGATVELMCHPGYLDPTLPGRDCRLGDGLMERRVDERIRLEDPSFLDACRQARFTLVRPSRLVVPERRGRHAA